MAIRIINSIIPTFKGKYIEVTALPTEDIKVNTIYKLTEGKDTTYWTYEKSEWVKFGNKPEVHDLTILENGTYDAEKVDGQPFDGYNHIIVDIEEAKPTQSKDISIGTNGTLSVTPDEGKTLSSVNVTTNITTKKPEEEKTITITDNGTVEVTPTSGKVMSKVKATTNISKPLQSKTVTVNGSVEPDDGYYGLSSVTVSVPIELQEKTITDNGEVMPDEGYYGLGAVNVEFNANPYIGDFINDTSTDDFVIPSGTTTIKPYAFYGKNYSGVVIPNSVTSIGENAFTGCDNLSTVYYGGPSEKWDENGFADHFSDNIILNCSDGTDAPDGLSYIINADRTEYRVGTRHKNVGTHVEIAEELYGLPVTEVGVKAFSENNTIQTVIIPNSVNKVSMYAFANCSNLSSITIGEGVATFSQGAFQTCKKLTEIKYNAINADDLSSPNSLFSMAGQSSDGITVTIGSKVTHIPSYLFKAKDGTNYYTPKITSVVFEEGSQCSSIGSYAFVSFSRISIVTMPNSITEIGYGGLFAFDAVDFSALTHIPAIQSNSFLPTCQIIVPDNLYDSWVATANWSQYKNNIVKASDVV